MTSPFVVSPVGYGDNPQGGQLMPMVIAARNPSNTIDKQYAAGYFWLSSLDMYQIVGGVPTYGSGNLYYQAGNTSGTPNWVLVSDSSGPIVGLLGTANQVTVTNNAGVATISTPSTFIAPGSIASTTTMAAGTALSAGTTITGTLGDITATNGNFVSSTAGKGLSLNSPSASGAAASPVVVNGRSGQATFTTVSIAAAADLTLTITNSAITGSSTQVIYSMSGATTGSALSIKSVTNSAGSSAIVVTNGTGATTTTANIVMNFLVVN